MIISWVVFAGITIVAAMLHFEGRRRLIQATAIPPTPALTTTVITTTIAPTLPKKHTRRGKKTAAPQPAGTPFPAGRPIPAAHTVPEQPILSNTIIWGRSALFGYVVWSLFWGLPPAFGMVRKLGSGALYGYFVIGCFWVGFIAALVLVAGFYYSIFGGGAVHFGIRWWKLAHVRTAAETIEANLRETDELHRRGVLTQPEHAKRRADILQQLP